MSLRVGTGLPNIQKESLYKFKIYVPNYNIQNRISLILMKLSESIKNEEKILKLYQKQKDYLLNKMFLLFRVLLFLISLIAIFELFFIYSP